MIEVNAIPRHLFFKNLFGFFVSDEPKLRNHGYQKKDGPLQAAVSPPDVIRKKKKICILWNVFYNMCKIQNYLIKSTVEKN